MIEGHTVSPDEAYFGETPSIDQEEYLESVLQRYGMLHEKHHKRRIPVADYEHLRPTLASDESTDIHQYQ